MNLQKWNQIIMKYKTLNEHRQVKTYGWKPGVQGGDYYPPSFVENSNELIVRDLCRKYPNNQELGAVIRQIFLIIK